jgi:pimeloyl-ACP methyl ester carboxylesterase
MQEKEICSSMIKPQAMKGNLLIVLFLFLEINGIAKTQNDGQKESKFGSLEKIAAQFRISEDRTVKMVRLPGNLHFEYVESGDPAGKIVIFLHGFTDSYHSFDKLLAQLPSSVHAYAITMRGHGNSDKPVSGYESRHFAADIVSFMDELRIDAATIAGHSMGATIAQKFAIDFPERTSGLILLGAIASYTGNDLIKELAYEVSQFREAPTYDFVLGFQKSTLAQPIPSAWFDTLIHETLKVPLRVWKHALKGMMNVDYTGELRHVLKPTLIIWGSHDQFATQADQEKLNKVVASSRLMIYRDAGHAPHWEEPTRVARDIYSFLNEKK